MNRNNLIWVIICLVMTKSYRTKKYICDEFIIDILNNKEFILIKDIRITSHLLSDEELNNIYQKLKIQL